MASKAVTKAAPAALPALVQTPALDIDHSDVSLPRIKLAQPSSRAAQDELVPLYSIYSQDGADDEYPAVLYKHGDEKGVLVHVLDVTKGKSVTIEGELFTYGFNDPAAPAEAWVTYNYVVCLPEVDADVPYKLLFTRSGMPTAKQINTVLKRNEATGPAYLNAFELTTAKRENDKGRFAVPRVRPVEATQEGIAAASKLASMVFSSVVDNSAPVAGQDEPAI